MKCACRLPLLALLILATPASPARADDAELEAIRAAIEAAGADWVAGHTEVSGLSPEGRRVLAGALPFTPPPGTKLEQYDGRNLPVSFDWRDNGGNWMTPVRYQDQCGSCWSFAAVAAMEATHNITAGDPTWDPDLSEQIVLSCSAGGCGGWYLENTMDYLMLYGTAAETCLPYQATTAVPCNSACGDFWVQPWRIDGWT